MQVNKIKNAKKSTQKVHKKRTPQKSSSKRAKQSPLHRIDVEKQKEFPSEFPFWARFKLNKNRTTLIIDEENSISVSGKNIELFVHREATHTEKGNEYEKIFPNPDVTDEKPMYLKRPHKHPKKFFGPHNKKLTMPQSLKEKYSKNNKK